MEGSGFIPARKSASIPTCDVPKTVADILTAAADLIEPEGAWLQGAYTEDLRCFCTLGALAHVSCKGATVVGSLAPAKTLAAYLNAEDSSADRVITRWNDAPERTQAEVVATLRAAAKKARTAPSDTQPGLPGEVNQSPANQEQDQ